jgi:hypothetical protein
VWAAVLDSKGGLTALKFAVGLGCWLLRCSSSSGGQPMSSTGLLGIKVDTGECVGVRVERGGAAVYTTVLCPSISVEVEIAQGAQCTAIHACAWAAVLDSKGWLTAPKWTIGLGCWQLRCSSSGSG